jgi:hypothetical protein
VSGFIAWQFFKALPLDEKVKLILGLIGKVKIMKNILPWLLAHKTYVVAVLAGVNATLTILGHPLPGWVWAILAAMGFGAIEHDKAMACKKAVKKALRK